MLLLGWDWTAPSSVADRVLPLPNVLPPVPPVPTLVAVGPTPAVAAVFLTPSAAAAVPTRAATASSALTGPSSPTAARYKPFAGGDLTPPLPPAGIN